MSESRREFIQESEASIEHKEEDLSDGLSFEQVLATIEKEQLKTLERIPDQFLDMIKERFEKTEADESKYKSGAMEEFRGYFLMWEQKNREAVANLKRMETESTITPEYEDKRELLVGSLLRDILRSDVARLCDEKEDPAKRVVKNLDTFYSNVNIIDSNPDDIKSCFDGVYAENQRIIEAQSRLFLALKSVSEKINRKQKRNLDVSSIIDYLVRVLPANYPERFKLKLERDADLWRHKLLATSMLEAEINDREQVAVAYLDTISRSARNSSDKKAAIEEWAQQL